MRRALGAGLALSALAAMPAAAQRTPDRAAQFDAFLTRALPAWRGVGFAVAVVKEGKVVFAKGYGERTLGRGEPVDTQTVFAIGSTTKAMIAASLGMLVDEGKVAWDDPVTKYLPFFQLGDPWITREITVRDLLTHRAGLGNADGLWYETGMPTAEILRRMRFIPVAYSMRSGFIYQNLGYATAGEVIRAASGMPWEAFVETRLFQPLHMTRSATSLARGQALGNVAAPHAIVDDTVRVIRNPDIGGAGAAGAIWSSVGDMAKWTQFMLDSGTVGGQRLLQPGTYAELLRPQQVIPPNGGFYPTARLTHPHWTTYALGWFQQDYRGRAVSFHTGSIDGMVAIIGLIPDERLGVYVLANLDHIELRHAAMLTAFDLWGPPGKGPDWSADLKQLYDGLARQAKAADREDEVKRVTGTTPALPLARYAGTYADSLEGAVEVVATMGGLELRATPLTHGPLEHWQYETFHVRWTDRWKGTAPVTFRIDEHGEPSEVEIGGTRYARRAAATAP